MNYLEQIEKLESEVYENMHNHSQLVIDIIEEISEDLSRDVSGEPIERDELGAYCYEISITIEIFNPERGSDISALKRLHDILDKWSKEVENVNIILGIPKHKG